MLNTIKYIETKLKQLNPEIKIFSYTFSGQNLKKLVIRIPLEGNLELINELRKTGWSLNCLDRIRTTQLNSNEIQGWNYPTDFILYQRMERSF